MDRSGVKKFSHQWGGWGGGLFCHQNQSYSKFPEMDRSGVKNFSLIWGGEVFCHQNQSCSKLPEMDRSGVQKFFPHVGWWGFSATKTKVAWNCLKWIDLVSKIFPSSGGGSFLPPKPKLLEIAWNGYIWCQKIFPHRGDLFCHQNQSCLKFSEVDRSGVKNFPLISGGAGYSATKTKVAWNCLKWIYLVSKNFPSLGWSFLPQKPKLLEIAWNG